MENELKSTLFQVVPFLLALGFLAVGVKRGKIKPAEIGLHRPRSWKGYFFWVVFFLLLALAMELLLYRLQLWQVRKWEYGLPTVLIRAIGILVLAPIVEEILFRGVLLAFLQRKGMAVYMAIVLQALAFVLMHGILIKDTPAAYIGVVQLFLDGVLFGLARHHTKSLYTPITMHFFGNSIAVIERLL